MAVRLESSFTLLEPAVLHDDDVQIAYNVA